MGCVVKEKVASYPVVEAQVLSKKKKIWMFCTGIDSGWEWHAQESQKA